MHGVVVYYGTEDGRSPAKSGRGASGFRRPGRHADEEMEAEVGGGVELLCCSPVVNWRCIIHWPSISPEQRALFLHGTSPFKPCINS